MVTKLRNSVAVRPAARRSTPLTEHYQTSRWDLNAGSHACSRRRSALRRRAVTELFAVFGFRREDLMGLPPNRAMRKCAHQLSFAVILGHTRRMGSHGVA